MNKEMSMEKRLLLAFVLMGLVLFGAQYLYKPPPAPPVKPPAAKVTNPAPAPAAKAPPAPEPAATVIAMPGQIQGDKEETITIDTDLYRVDFSNRGAVVRSWILKAYKDHQGKPLELVNEAALSRVPAPFARVF